MAISSSTPFSSLSPNSDSELIEFCIAAWPQLREQLRAALDDTREPTGSELEDLNSFMSTAYYLAETNNARVSAVVVESALRALYLYATGKDAVAVDPHEADTFDPDFEIDIWTDKINKASLAYRVLFCEKPDQRFLSIAGAWSCYQACRRALVNFLSSRDITCNSAEEGGVRAWAKSVVPGDVLFETLRNAALEAIMPPLLFQFGNVATRVTADYAPEISTDLANRAKSLAFHETPRCILELFIHEMAQLCSIDMKHFLVFENRPKQALLGIKKHREKAKERHPPLIVFLVDGSCYLIHERLGIFEHYDIYKALNAWMEVMKDKPVLGTLSIRKLYIEIKKHV